MRSIVPTGLLITLFSLLTVHRAQAKSTVTKVDRTCTSSQCHGRVVKARHASSSWDGCTSCHVPKAALPKGRHPAKAFTLARSAAAAQCATCHKTALQKFAQVHGPFALGDCTSCHSPHSSDSKTLLVASGRKLCFRCHDTDRFSAPVQHAAIKKTCTNCHAPHGAQHAYFLRKKIGQLCAQCHAPGSAGQKLAVRDTCLGCHEPHASKHARLLKRPGGKKGRRCDRPSKARAVR